MSFSFMPLYTGDYLRDTRHLSMSEHGCYLLMLTFCWDSKGPLPLDERKISGICNARSGDEIEAMRRVLAEFFVKMDDGFYNKRIQAEIERSESISRSRSEAGRKGYEAKAKQLPSKRQASASTPTPTPISTPTPTPEKSKPLSGKPDVTRPEAWDFKQPPKPGEEAEYLLAFLNKVTDSKYRAVESNLKFLRARLTEATVREVKQVIVHRAEVWEGDEKMVDYLRPETLFNATKFHSYLEAARKRYAEETA